MCTILLLIALISAGISLIIALCFIIPFLELMKLKITSSIIVTILLMLIILISSTLLVNSLIFPDYKNIELMHFSF